MESENITQINRSDIRRIRHRAEIPLFILCIVITMLLIALVIVLVIAELTVYDYDGLYLYYYYYYDNGFELLFYMLPIPFSIFFVVNYYYAKARAYAIRVSEKNFPEIYAKSLEFAKKLGMKKVPGVYIQQYNGVLNAFASATLRRRYIKLTAELVDVAYMENKDFDTVYFVLAHEFAHHYFKHVWFPYLLLKFVPNLIPVFGPLHKRSREYSCDRLAQLLMGRDCVDEAMILSAGRHLYKHVDTEDYLAHTKKEGGIFLWFVNLNASHPIMPKRLAALADPEKRSGKLL